MGSRGSFVNVSQGNFSFKENGQTYYSIGNWNNVKVLVRNGNSVKAPEFSHTAERIYAIVQNGKLKHLAFYDKEHKQAISIDLLHEHKGIMPHKHLYLNHSDNGIPINAEEKKLIYELKRRFRLQ